MKTIGFILLSLMCTSYTAQASSAEAWKKHDQNLKAACIKASQLKNTKVVSDIMSFDDRVGYSAVVLEGRYPQAHMKALDANYIYGSDLNKKLPSLKQIHS